MGKNQLQEAEPLLRKAIELDPKYCDAMDNLGVVLRRLGNIEQAIEWYKRSIQANVSFGLELRGIRQCHERIQAALEEVGLAHLAEWMEAEKDPATLAAFPICFRLSGSDVFSTARMSLSNPCSPFPTVTRIRRLPLHISLLGTRVPRSSIGR